MLILRSISVKGIDCCLVSSPRSMKGKMEPEQRQTLIDEGKAIKQDTGETPGQPAIAMA